MRPRTSRWRTRDPDSATERSDRGWLAILACFALALTASANGIYRNGFGARSMSLGGADVAWAEGPISALGNNPAGLRSLEQPTLELSMLGAWADGEFRNRSNHDGGLDRQYGFVPDGAVGFPLGSGPVSLGVALVPDALLSADWRYRDTPGGLGGAADYGVQPHHAEITLLRSAFGLGISLGPKVSIGGSVGLLYNRNVLESPYIFQSHPVLKGVKTLLDLDTDGFGANGNVGLLFRPHDSWQIGLSYTTPATVHSHGDALGDAGIQLQSLGGDFRAFRPDFHYDAEVINTFPQSVSGGVSWKVHQQVRLALQVDWIDWAHAFDELRIKLTQGDNADLNALAGASSVDDAVPLRWRDQWVYRAGLEWAVSENFRLRGGYAYGRSPVPDATLTPLTAAILEHTFSAGMGYRRGRWGIDLGYQFDLPKERHVAQSVLQAGEYSASEVKVGIHWIGLSTSIRF